VKRTFFALVGDAGLERVHLSLHATHNALTLARLVVVRDTDDDDQCEEDPGHDGHDRRERHAGQQEPTGGRLVGQLQLADVVRPVPHSHLHDTTKRRRSQFTPPYDRHDSAA